MIYIGISGKPLGIKLTVYNEKKNKDTGLFLTIDNLRWRKMQTSPNNEKKKKYKVDNTLSDEFYLRFILERKGFEIILKCITIEEKDNEPFLAFKTNSFVNGGSNIEQLENVLSIYNIIKSYKRIL